MVGGGGLRGLETLMGSASVGNQDRLNAPRPRQQGGLGQIANHGMTGATLLNLCRIDNADDSHLGLDGAEDRDFSQITCAPKRNVLPAAGPLPRSTPSAVAPGAAEEIERRSQIFGGQAALLGEAARVT